MGTGMENYTVKYCSKYAHDDYIYKKEKHRRHTGGSWGRGVVRRMLGSVATVAKITLVCLNIWVLAVVLVVSLGHWRVFETVDSSAIYDNSHLIVMRELKEDSERKLPIMAMSVTNISEVESYYVPPEDDLIFKADAGDEGIGVNLNKGDGETKGGGRGGEEVLAKGSETLVKKVASSKDQASETSEKKSAPPVANPQPPAAPKKSGSPLSLSSDADGMSRIKNLRHWCDQQHSKKTSYDKIPTWKLKSIVYDEKHKLLFCQIPGAALNEWRKIMLITTKVVNTTAPSAIAGGDVFGKYGKSLKKLSDISDASERAGILSNFHKVIFVRDPLERLVFMYKSKIKSPSSKYFHSVFGSPIIKKYRKDASEEEIKAGSSVTFSEFVNYVVDTEHEGKVGLNEHWQQYYKQCHPCMVDYDFVGTFENVEADTRTVLQKVDADKKVKPPYIANRKILSEKELTAFYKGVDVSTLKRLYKVYLADYTLFGYKCPPFLHTMLEKADAFHDY